MQLNTTNRVYLRAYEVAMAPKMSARVQEDNVKEQQVIFFGFQSFVNVFQEKRSNCHYTGRIRDKLHSTVVLNTCRGLR